MSGISIALSFFNASKFYTLAVSLLIIREQNTDGAEHHQYFIRKASDIMHASMKSEDFPPKGIYHIHILEIYQEIHI